MGKIAFRVYKDLKLVHFMGAGAISYAYLVEQIMRVNNHPDFDFSFNTFVDFEDAIISAKKGGLQMYQDFFRKLQHTTGRRRWAIYSRNVETLQNANMAHLLDADRIEVDVFEVRAQALAYLGLDEAAFSDSHHASFPSVTNPL